MIRIKDIFSTPISSGNIVTILDIGSSKIVCLIANVTSKQISIVGSGCHSARGFKNGNITDTRAAKSAIIAAVDQAEKAAGIAVEKVVLALNGNKIRSHYLQPSMNLRNQKVSSRDVKQLIAQGVKELEDKDYEVIHFFPLEFIIDGNNDIKEPCGLLGNKLSARIHFVTVSSPMLDNIVNCLASCQLDVDDCIFAPYAAGLATLNDNDKEFGATVIDFGAGITSYALFSQNNMINCGFIPIGSRAITNDIAKSFMLDLATAERIKTIHGAASVHYADNQKMINYKTDYSLPGQFDNEERSISNAELNNVINARIDEVLNLLKSILDKQNQLCPNAKHSIVLTGGGSMLTGINEEATKIFGSKVRLGKPMLIPGLSQDAVNATYAAAIGVLQYLSNNHLHEQNLELTKPSFIRRAINWLRDNF